MKLKYILAGTLFAGLAASALAQTTDITITGATAFRTATLQAIYNAYDSEGDLGVDFFVCHSSNGTALSNLTGSNQAVFKGKFPGINGITYIRTSFNGSTEGLNAIAGNNATFLQQSAVQEVGGIQGAVTTPTETLRPKFSFSDVYQSSSPVDNVELNPAGASAVGIVTFCMVANEGAPENLTNVTNQQARILWKTGLQPLSLFTGDPADNATRVYATGRNDGSGTRAAYLTEWTYGVANLVNQYIATKTGTTATEVTAITRVPEDGKGSLDFETSGASNASTLWGNTALGNGGYSSSSSLRTLMGLTSTSVTVYDGETNDPIAVGRNLLLLTWLSTADSRTAAQNGAKILSYNGVSVTPLATDDPANYQNTGFSEADFKKIATGAYSPWSYQHLYYHGSLSTEEQAWYTAMKATWLPTALQETANGVRLSDVSVTRPDDGFPIVGRFQ